MAGPYWISRLYVLDGWFEPVPLGVAGELYIGGSGLARGYVGQPGLTAGRFVPDPHGPPGGRLYRTGDLARWRAGGDGQGVLEFLGRADQQVKVRGFRVELGEIEAALLAQPEVAAAAVAARAAGRAGAGGSDQRLVAYLVARPGAAAPGVSELRARLAGLLPEHMLPAAFVWLDALPLTANGKLDRKALPAPGAPEPGQAYRAPRDATEAVLAGLWAELLGLERVGVEDNFFELGGDSILSIQLVARARAAGLAITPRQVFQHQSVAALAAAAEATGGAVAGSEPGLGPLPLTAIQHWFFALPGPVHHYNQAFLLQTPPGLDPDRLEQALQQLAGHHDALRLRFTRSGDGWRQENLAAAAVAAVRLARFDLGRLPPPRRAACLEAEGGRLQAGLDPQAGDLVRAAWFDFGPGEPGRLLLAIHHLAVDGVSWRILLADLLLAYARLGRGEPAALPPRTTSFQHWAGRLAAHAHDPVTLAELPFWQKVVGGAVPSLPVDHDPAAANTVGGAARLVSLLPPAETRQLLAAVPAAYHSRINDVLLTALALAVAGWRQERGQAGTTALLLELEGHGREEGLFAGVDLSRTVGWFTSLYPVRLDLGRSTWRRRLRAGRRRGPR